MATTLTKPTHTTQPLSSEELQNPDSGKLSAETQANLALQQQPYAADITEIMKRIPHRYPFLMIDRVLHVDPGKTIHAYKSVTMNEPFFQGHFPGKPLMPGVLIVEAIAQAGAYLLSDIPQAKGKLVVFAGINDVRFKRQVIPGDRLDLFGEINKVRDSFGKASGRAVVNGEIVCSCELLFSFIPGIEDPNL